MDSAVETGRAERGRSPWRDEPPPLRWRLYAAMLVCASLPFFIRGLVALAAPPVGHGFLIAVFVALVAANACILQLPPYRFLHLVTGFVMYGTFFIAGPAVIGLNALAMTATVLLMNAVRRFGPFRDWRPLGSDFGEYAVPDAALTIILGSVDALRRTLDLAYPYQFLDAAAVTRLSLLQAAIYWAWILLNELGIYLRFGWQRAFGTRQARADLLVYVLMIFLGGPLVACIAWAYGPDFEQEVLACHWILWGFATFAVAQLLVQRRLEIERLLTVIGQQERLVALGRLASVIAHQTRHHLGILNMSAYVLGETLGREPLSAPARAGVARELEAMMRTRAELDRLLTEELRGDAAVEEFGPLGLARECERDLAPLARARAIGLAYDGTDAPIRGDRLRLKQAIGNVMRNAIEAAPSGSVVAVALAEDTSDVTLTIRDRGPGLSAAARAHLFEPLFTDKTDGLGMGLYVARAIVEAHGGAIRLTTTEHGTEVGIRLGRIA